MGEIPTRARAKKDTLKDAEAVLARSVLGPRMDAIAALAVAAEAAADPDRIRGAAQDRADKFAEQANTRGRELIEAARQKAQALREGAVAKRRDLLAQAEADIQAGFAEWQAAYRAACAAGWTPEQLAEAGQPAPPARPPRRSAARHAAAAADNPAADAAGDSEAGRAEPAPADPAVDHSELPARVPA